MATASEILDELDDILDNLGQVTGATRALSDAFGTLNASVGDAGKALASAATPAQSLEQSSTGAAKAISQVAEASKGAAPAVLGAGKSGSAAAAGFNSLKNSAMSAIENLKPTSGVLGAITSALESMGPKGKAAALALTVLVTVMTAGARAFWSLVESAVAISQEKDALGETFAALSDGAKSGVDAVNDLADVAAQLPQAEGRVLSWGRALMAAGKQGEALERSVRAVAASDAIMRNGGQAALEFSKRLQLAAEMGEKIRIDRRMQKMLAETGVTASDLAARLGIAKDKLADMPIDAAKLGEAFEEALIAKGGPALEKMSLTWTSITAKMSDAWEDLFEDLGPAVEPVMRAIRDFFAEFSAGTALQGAAKSAVTSFFTTVMGWAQRAMSAVHLAFLEAQIAALRVYIALAPIVRALRAVLTNSHALIGIKVIFGLLMVPLVLLIGLVLGLVAAIGFAVGVLGTLAGFVVGIVSTAIGFVSSLVVRAVEALKGLAGSAKGAASGFISGLVAGINSGVGAVVSAVTGLASSALSAFTSFFQIKSPSRLMKKQGAQLPAGAAEGVEEGSADVDRAVEEMYTPKARRKAGARGGPVIYQTNTFNYTGRASEFPSFRAQADKWLEEISHGGPEAEFEGA